MLTHLVLSAAVCLPGPAGEELPDFNAVEWWNSIPLTLEQLRRLCAVEDPDDIQVRKSFDVPQPQFEFRPDLEHALVAHLGMIEYPRTRPR